MFERPDPNDYIRPTLQQQVQDYVLVTGRKDPSIPWILSPYDTWHANPFYTGEPVDHPESEY